MTRIREEEVATYIIVIRVTERLMLNVGFESSVTLSSKALVTVH